MPVMYFVVDQLSDMFDQARLIDVIRNLIDDKPLTIALHYLFDADHAAQDKLAAAGMVGLFDSAIAADDAACRKVRPWHHLHDLIDACGRIVEQQQRRLDQARSRLCGGIFVAIPTAIPEEPLQSRLGNFGGKTVGSFFVSS